MTLQNKDQLPLSLEIADKRDVRSQFGALCYRMKQGEAQVLMITSRRTGRWVIPKGWPIRGLKSDEAALQEAWEEAEAKWAAMEEGEMRPV